MTDNPYDALLVISFGGPEGPDDVMPFLENVLRGKNVPHQRMLEVAEHYKHFGGVSPINEQNRQLIAAIKADFAEHNLDLPIYWGNRNWHPLIPDTLRQMKETCEKIGLNMQRAKTVGTHPKFVSMVRQLGLNVPPQPKNLSSETCHPATISVPKIVAPTNRKDHRHPALIQLDKSNGE